VKQRAWWIYLTVMAPVIALYLFGPALCQSGPMFNAIGLSAVAAILVGLRLHRPGQRAPWYLFALAQTLFVAGDVIAYNFERLFGRSLPFPSLADAFYLSFFLVIVTGLLVLIRRRSEGADRASLIDALVIAVGAGLFTWIYLMAPYAHDASLSEKVKLTAMAYPLMDLILLTVTVRLAVGRGARARSEFLMIVSVAALFATDAVYGWLQLHGIYQPGGLLDFGWIVFYLLWGAAALHPSMARAKAASKTRRLTRLRLLVFAAASFVAPVTSLFGSTSQSDRIVVAASSIVLFSLVLVRMVGLVRQQEAATAGERELRKTTARLRQLDRQKDQFITTVSHELRTPLTSIHGYVTLLVEEEEALSDERRGFLSIIARNTERLRRLVDDLLLISEIDAGKLKLKLNTLDLPALARESVESARPAAQAGDITLDFSAESPLRLTGDRLRLGQLLDNVISNALKFTPPGGRVSIRTSRTNGSAFVEIEDTGVGIANEDLSHLFDRFYRTEGAEESAVQGSGLGLAISQAIAEAHGGLIGVTSEENVGTTFRIALPAT
jgi:signal transduction histidine kinase